jgi:hypothetical protein
MPQHAPCARQRRAAHAAARARLRPRRPPQGKNWSASGGSFSNGNGAPIANPGAYFGAVASNAQGYNASYSNGHGQAINNPGAYFAAVSRCAGGEPGWGQGG